jgi:hypothetical protein
VREIASERPEYQHACDEDWHYPAGRSDYPLSHVAAL